MNRKLVSICTPLILTTGRATFTGSLCSEILEVDDTFFDYDNISVNKNLELIKDIFNKREDFKAIHSEIADVLILALQKYYIKMDLHEFPGIIDDELEMIEILLSQKIEGNKYSGYLGLEIAVRDLKSLYNNDDILFVCQYLKKYAHLTSIPEIYVKLILDAETKKAEKTNFFIRTGIDFFDSIYVAQYLYENSYFRGTICPKINNCHGIIHHQNFGKVIVQVPYNFNLPKYVRLTIDEANNFMLRCSSEQESKNKFEIIESEKTAIANLFLLKNGEKEFNLKVTADQKGNLKAPGYFNAGLIRFEDLHRMFILKDAKAERFSSYHYKQLMEYLLNLYKDRNTTYTFRVTEITNDKKMPNIDLGEDLESLDFLLDNPEGRIILYMDIELILRLQSKGLKTEIMLPNVKSLDQIMKVKAIIAEIREKLSKQGVDTCCLKLGAMVENPFILKDIENIAQEVDFLCIGVNDMSNTYSGLRRKFPTVFSEQGNFDLNKLSEKMVKTCANRKSTNNMPIEEIVLSSDFIKFIKINFFDKMQDNSKLRACGNIDKYMAAILFGLGVSTVSADSFQLEDIYFYLKEFPEKELFGFVAELSDNKHYLAKDIRINLDNLKNRSN